MKPSTALQVPSTPAVRAARRAVDGACLVFLLMCDACPWPARASDLAARTAAAATAAAQESAATEAAEGVQDLVDDEVSVKIRDGTPVIEQTGEASFYGQRFQGRRTASGERFDQRKDTAAHPTLPLGSTATVTNLDNGRQVEVEINDRGPHVQGRDLDLSKAAAESIGLGHEEGVAPVSIEARLPGAEEEAGTE